MSEEDMRYESVTWGGKRMMNFDKLYEIAKFIKRRQRFHVNNGQFGEDPKPGETKSCTIRWRWYPDGPINSETAEEGSYIDFGKYKRPELPDVFAPSADAGEEKLEEVDGRDHEVMMNARVRGVEYGGVTVRDPAVVDRLNDALERRRNLKGQAGSSDWRSRQAYIREFTVSLSNDTLGGDPKPGVVKQARIRLKNAPYLADQIFVFEENAVFPPDVNGFGIW